MKKVGLSTLVLVLFLLLVGCGNSLNTMDGETKEAVKAVMDFKNKYHKKNNEKRKNYEFDSGYLPTDLSEKDVLQVYLMKAKNEENNVFYIRYNETEFSDLTLKKKLKDHIRVSVATFNGKEYEPISETEFNQVIEKDSVDKIFEAKE